MFIQERIPQQFDPFELENKFPDIRQGVFERISEYANDINVEAITYESDGLRVNGFIVFPKENGTFPCIIYNRGGNLEFGALNEIKVWGDLALFASWGYVVIASQYRGNAGSEGQEEFGGQDINDVLNLVGCLKEHPQADTTSIGLYGFSRGGMMSLLALQHKDIFRAAVVGAPLVDLVDQPRPEMRAVQKKLIAKDGEELVAELKKRSALYWPEKIDPKVPILLLQGSSDWRVDPQATIKFAAAMTKLQRPLQFILFDGADHGISEYRKGVRMMTKDWFDRFLKQDEQLPNTKPHGE